MMMVTDGRVGLLQVVLSDAAIASSARAIGEWARQWRGRAKLS
jgi:hypothetical protein